MSAAIATKESVKGAALDIPRDPQRKLTVDEVMRTINDGSRSTLSAAAKRRLLLAGHLMRERVMTCKRVGELLRTGVPAPCC